MTDPNVKLMLELFYKLLKHLDEADKVSPSPAPTKKQILVDGELIDFDKHINDVIESAYWGKEVNENAE